MANGGRIDFTIGYKVDEAGIAKIRHQLEELSSMSATQIQKANPNLNMGQARAALLQIRDAAGEVQTAMQSAFNPTTGVMNLERLRNSLQQLNLQQIQQAFNQAGQTGQSAFLGISKAALTTSVQLRQTEGILDRMGQTLANTIRWSISSSAINAFTGAIQQAYGYVQHLDTSLNDIRIVTGKSADEMDKFAEKANDAAKALGASTTDYTEAALIYYQQGLSDEESQARAETTLKAANVTGQTGREVSEQLTSVWNGYKVTAEETEMYVDKLAAVAATTASDLEELSTGMSKVASAANNMGVDVDQLNAQLATIISVTRQAPETAGTALKTIYARLEDLKISGEDEEGVKLGEVSSTLDELGIHVIDAEGNLRDLGEVIEEVASKWDTWTKAQQSAAAQAMAGKRQYNNLLALFDNWDMYTSALETSRNSLGTLQEQQDIYMESTAAHLQKLETQWEDLYDSLLNSDDINSVADILTKLVDIITDIVDATGGLKGMLSGLVGLIGTTFSRQIANAFGPFISNINAARQNAEILDQLLANITFQRQTGAISGQAAQEMTEAQEAMSRYWSVMSEEEINASQQTIREIGDWADRREAIERATQSMITYFETYGDQRSRNIVANNTQITDFQSTNTDVEYLTKRLEKGQRAIEGMVDYSKQLEKAMNQTNVQTVKFGTNSRQVRTQLANVNGSIVEIERRMQRANRLGLIDPQQLASAQNLIAKIRQEMSDIQNPNTRKTSFTQELIDDLVKLGNLTGTSKAQIQGYLDTLRNGASSFEDCQTAIRGLRTALGETELQTRAFIQGITQLVGAFSSLYYGINSVSNIGEIFADDKLDGVEKFKQTLMALLMGLPMIVRGLQALSSALQFFTNTTSLAAAMTSLLQGGISGLVTGFRTLSATILSIPGVGWILAITAALTALIAIVKAHQKALENDAEAAKENAKAQQEKIDKTKQEKDKIDELAKSYENLLNQKEKDKDFSKEQKNEIYNLVKAYGDQSLIIKALAGDYEGLRDAIRGAQNAANDKLIQDLTQGQKDYNLQLESNIMAKGGISEIDSEGFDFSFGGDPSEKTANFKDSLRLLLNDQDAVSDSGHISYDNLIKLLTTETEDLQKFLNRYKDLSAATQIRELLSENAEVIQSLKQTQKDLTEAELSKLGYGEVDNIDEIKNVGEYSNKLADLANKAWEKGLVESYDKGEEWASQFLSGYSDELNEYDKQNTIADVIFDKILPSDEELQAKSEEIANQLKMYQLGGNVDLLNRPIINNEDGSWSTVSTQTVANEKGNIAINFTPYVTDADGNVIEVLTKEALEKYGQDVINGVHDDFKHIQIGFEFVGDEAISKAEAAAQKIHELQMDYFAEDAGINPYQDTTDKVYENLEKLNDSQQSFIAGHIDLFKAIYKQTGDIDKAFDNLSKELDAVSHADHVVTIDVLFNNKEGSKDYEEALQELFNDDQFNMGISIDDFKYLEDDEKTLLLLEKRRQEAEKFNQLSEEEKRTIEERNRELQHQIDENATIILQKETELELAKKQAEVDRGNQEDLLFEKGQNVLGESRASIEDIYNQIDPEETLDEYKEKILNVMDQLAVVYKEATAEGKDGIEAINQELEKIGDSDVDAFFEKYFNQLYDEYGDRVGKTNDSMKTLISLWTTSTPKVNKLTKELEDLEEENSSLAAAQEEVSQQTFNWKQQVANSKAAISELNKSIDSLQKSYQSLQGIVEDYNADGKLSLDNLQALLEMDDAYVAALDIQNGQMTLNDQTMREAIDLKIEMGKVETTEAYIAQMNALAHDEMVTTGKEAILTELKMQEAIQGTIDAANKGYDALMKYAKSQNAAAFGKNKDLAEMYTKAYYNRMQLWDNVGAQSTSEILSKEDKSSSKESKEKEAKHEDHLEREADLYRNINQELKQIESTLGRIQKENNYKWGKDLQEGLKRENKLLDQQLAKLREKSKMQEKDLGQRRAQLEAQGYQFSEDGSTITNAEAKLDALYASYNAMIDNYNNMSADQQEEYKKQLDEEKKNIDKIEKGLKDYESLFSDYQGTLDSILDLHYQQIENAVSRFNNMVDVHLELDNARKEWNDFWYEVVEDAENLNFGTNIDYFEKKIEQSMGKLSTLLGIGGNAKDSEISTLTKHLNETVTQVEAQIASKNRGGEDSLFEDATKLSKENLETYREKLMSALREAKEEVNNIAENYLNLLDTAQKKIDKQIDGWESVSNHIEHNLELIKLVSGEKAFEPLLKQYDKLYETNLKTIEAQKTGQDYWADQIQKYEKLLETTEEGTVQWKTYSEALEKASENYKKSVEGLDKSVEKALKDLEEWRKTQVESILDTLDKAMTHGAGLEFVKEEWNLINEYSSRYLDNVERAVETELYTNDLEKAANATGITAKNQERINKFREEELKKLKEKEKLSQYDIDESRARLNILQQEIALEEARNNKSNMRLRRDSQGNYTYQYTGDDEAQNEAENGLLTAKKEWYELVKNRHKETTDWIIEDTQRYYDYIKKADEERAKGNEEGYKNYMNLAQEAYKAIEDDAAEMNKNAQDLLSGTAQFFSDVKDASILPTSKAMAASMNKDIGTIKEAGEKAVNALTATQQKFGEKTKKILEQAGINYENLTEKGIDPTQDALEDLNGTNEELEQSLEDVNKVLEEQESLLAEAEEAYNNFKDAAVEALQAAQRAWEELAETVIESQHQIQAEIQTTQQMQQQSNATSPSAFRSTRDDGGGGDGGNNSQESDEYAMKESGFGKTVIYKKSNPSQYIEAFDRNSIDEWKKKQLSAKYPGVSFATGGYTGDWDNSDGRLAVLHQKELVLNESDTSNLLKVIAVLRQVVTSINFSGIADSLVNSTAQWMSRAATQPLANNNISNISSVNNDTNNNYKNFTVNADFSGVRSAEAIYQALTNLENYGMQESYSVAPYANKSY